MSAISGGQTAEDEGDARSISTEGMAVAERSAQDYVMNLFNTAELKTDMEKLANPNGEAVREEGEGEKEVQEVVEIIETVEVVE